MPVKKKLNHCLPLRGRRFPQGGRRGEGLAHRPRTDVFNRIHVSSDMKKHTTALLTLEEGRCREIFKEMGVTSGAVALDALAKEFEAYREVSDCGKTIPAVKMPEDKKPPGRSGRFDLSERRDLNSRHPPWQGGALPLSYFRIGEESYTESVPI